MQFSKSLMNIKWKSCLRWAPSSVVLQSEVVVLGDFRGPTMTQLCLNFWQWQRAKQTVDGLWEAIIALSGVHALTMSWLGAPFGPSEILLKNDYGAPCQHYSCWQDQPVFYCFQPRSWPLCCFWISWNHENQTSGPVWGLAHATSASLLFAHVPARLQKDFEWLYCVLSLAWEQISCI